MKLALAIVCSLAAVAAAQPAASQAQQVLRGAAASSSSCVKMDISSGDGNKGSILAQLDAAKAPITVKNFLSYVSKSFYSNTIFHRVIPGFMIQGGGFTADMSEKPTDAPIKNEAANGLNNRRGTLAMARTSDPDSATAQFFINHADNTNLDHTSDDASGMGCAF